MREGHDCGRDRGGIASKARFNIFPSSETAGLSACKNIDLIPAPVNICILINRTTRTDYMFRFDLYPEIGSGAGPEFAVTNWETTCGIANYLKWKYSTAGAENITYASMTN